MIFLYFLLDVVFYNYTSWQTHLFLLAFLEKKSKTKTLLLFAFIIDYLLSYQGKFFLPFLLLWFLNQSLKISYEQWTSHYLRFFLLYGIYQTLTFLLFHILTIQAKGLLLTLLFVGFSYKKAFRS